MKNELIKLIQEKAPSAKPLFLVIRGSHAYGTNIETSDTDYAGVFAQSLDDLLENGQRDQINDDKNDIVIYELKRFVDLLSSNNPTVLELLNTPEDCILYKDPIFDELTSNRDKFLTKICAKSFGGYATMQIQKAKGMNKKQNWEKDRVTRKEVLDFVYVIKDEKTIPWKIWNSEYGFEEKFCGVVNVPNARDVYAVYFDNVAYNLFSDNVSEEVKAAYRKQREDMAEAHDISSSPYCIKYGLGYKGLVKTGEGNNPSESNALRLSSIPLGQKAICNIFYNKDGYSQHCKEFREYQEWLEKRNTQRWVDVQSHGQQIDGKNLMHCKRLTAMAREIAEDKGICVRRTDAQYLLEIRRGKVDLQSLIDSVEAEIKETDEMFANSNLPEKVDEGFSRGLLLKMRKEIYNLK